MDLLSTIDTLMSDGKPRTIRELSEQCGHVIRPHMAWRFADAKRRSDIKRQRTVSARPDRYKDTITVGIRGTVANKLSYMVKTGRLRRVAPATYQSTKS